MGLLGSTSASIELPTRGVLLSQISGEASDFLGDAVQAELVQQPNEMVGECLPLDNYGQQAPAPCVDEALLLHQPGVDMVEQKGCSGRELD